MRDRFRTIVSWLTIFIGLAFVLSINTTKIDAGGQFIDFARWGTLTFWVQLIVNTLFLVQLYAMILNNRTDDLIIGNDDIDQEYSKLFKQKDEIINSKKKTHFEEYLDLVVNLVERLELFKYKLQRSIARHNKRRSKRKYARINALSEEIGRLDKYMSALKNGKSDIIMSLDVDINQMTVRHERVTYDVIFNTVDYDTNKPISVGYSDTKDRISHIRRSPVSAFGSMFLAVVAFGNVLVANDDWRSVLLIMLAVAFGALYKILLALRHAEKIAKNKRRSLVKTTDMIKVFLTWDDKTIDGLRDAVYYQAAEEIEEIEEEEEIEITNPFLKEHMV